MSLMTAGVVAQGGREGLRHPETHLRLVIVFHVHFIVYLPQLSFMDVFNELLQFVNPMNISKLIVQY